ncbi:nitrate- and nitrite sensing domain-containing protein, partial [Aliarcobacter vitoriensis]
MLSKLTIKKKLIISMMVPLLVISFFTIKLIVDSTTVSNNLKALDEVINLSTKIGSLVHETQKERGLTAGFLGSKGKSFRNELLAEKIETDKKISEFKMFLTTFNKDYYSSDFIENLNYGINKLDELSNIRKNVDNLSINPQVAISYYTETNKLLLNVIGTVIQLSTNSDISQELVAYMNFLLSKERTGLERAVGTNTFAKNYFDLELKTKFYTLVAEQSAYIDTFIKVSPKKTIDFYNITMKDKSIEEVNKMREVALYSGKEADFNIDANYWFETVTEKINLLKKVEDYLADNLHITIERELNNAKNNIIIFGTLSILGIVVFVIISMLISNSIIRSINNFKEGLLGFFAYLNRESNTTELLEDSSKDEFGQMAKVVNENIIKTKAGI